MSSFDLVQGEEIILQATLRKDKWKAYRCAVCSCRLATTIYGAPFALLYWLIGGNSRQEEADSFELILTNYNLHFRQKLYQCGCFWQASGTKTIPLDKIQDIALMSDFIGDCCNIVDTKGEVYQLHIQTAAMGSSIAELSVYCIENPREFKRQVLEAKRRVITDTCIVGQSKTLDVQPGVNQQELTRVISLLERQLQRQNTQ